MLGRDFTHSDARFLLDVGRPHLVPLLEPAVTARLLERDGDQFRFAHLLVRDALYETLPIADRRAAHERLARRGREAGVRTNMVVDCAHHSVAAAELGSTIEVVGPALRAGRAAASVLGHSEAIRWFETALAAGPTGDQHVAVLMEVGEAQLRGGHSDIARTRFENAFAAAVERDDPCRIAEAALAVGRCVVTAGTIDWPLVSMLEQAQAAQHPDALAARRLHGNLEPVAHDPVTRPGPRPPRACCRGPRGGEPVPSRLDLPAGGGCRHSLPSSRDQCRGERRPFHLRDTHRWHRSQCVAR